MAATAAAKLDPGRTRSCVAAVAPSGEVIPLDRATRDAAIARAGAALDDVEGEIERRLAERFAAPELVHRGPGHLAGQLHEGPVHRYEDDVAGLETHFAGIDPMQQVIVEVEGVHQLASSTDLDPAEAAVR